VFAAEQAPAPLLEQLQNPWKKCRKLFREPSKRFKSEQLMKKSRGGFLLLQKKQKYNSIFYKNCAKTVVTKSVGEKRIILLQWKKRLRRYAIV